MANLRVLAFVALAALLLAPAAVAQQPTPVRPVASITTFTITPDAATIPLGGQQDFNVSMTLELTNVICPQGGTATVNLLAGGMAAMPGITASPPTSMQLVMPAPAPGTPPSTTSTFTGTGVIPVAIANSAPGNHQHVFMINATFQGAGAGTTTNPTGCNSSPVPDDTFAPALATKTLSITTGRGTDGNTTTTPPIGCTAGSTAASCTMTSTTTEAAPLADVPTVALLVLAVALVASRRLK